MLKVPSAYPFIALLARGQRQEGGADCCDGMALTNTNFASSITASAVRLGNQVFDQVKLESTTVYDRAAGVLRRCRNLCLTYLTGFITRI